MSTWHVRAIERLGTPLPSWPTIWGPAAPGSDPLAANGLRTVDLTPHLSPLQEFSSILERDLSKASFSSISLDLEDSDEALATLLGPNSSTLATTSRYFGPWIEVTEVWATGSAVRWTGFLDETSLQWDEAQAATKATALHASQLLRERRLAEMPELLRPYPTVPTIDTQDWVQSTADALLDAAAPSYTPRGGAAAIEAALWAVGQLSWKVAVSYQRVSHAIYHPDADPTYASYETHYPVPAQPASTIVIAGTTYPVDHLAWDISEDVIYGDMDTVGTLTRYQVVRIYLQGAPNLTGLLTLGATVDWGVPEAQRTHYVLVSSVSAPASGTDGQRWLRLNTVEQIVAGEGLTITFWDTVNSVQRRATMDVTVVDVDGEKSWVWLLEPIDRELLTSKVLKIRRNSRNPVLFDGVAYAAKAIAPFTLDTTCLKPAATSRPVLTWMPHDAASPQLYGIHSMQSIDRAGGLRLARRGAVSAGGSTYPLLGCWEGGWASSWLWLGCPAASSPLEVFGDLNQWPGGSNTNRPPVIYIHGDLSAGATIPPNGWRGTWRSWASPRLQIQDFESSWNGTAISWEATAHTSAVIPAKVVAFVAQTASPGRYTRTSAPAWSFQAHTGAGTLGTASTPTITGTLPTGNFLALGMGIYASGDEQEALLALITTNTAQPFTNMSAALLSQASGGNLTLRQSVSLWTTGAIAEGSWALGGGLVVQTTTETIDGVAYPMTILHKLDGTAHLTATFRTLEIIPHTIQPLSLSGTAGSKDISGWYALAIETYQDDQYAISRRLRFLWLNATLELISGDFEVDPADPLNPSASFRRGDLVATGMGDGAASCRLLRTGVGDACVGFLGGRLFQIDKVISHTLERLELGDTSSIGKDASGLSAAEYVEKLAQALLASAIPDATGNIRLVSRGSGPLQVQSLAGSNKISVQASQRSARRTLQTYRGYVSEVRVSYTDAITGEAAQAVVAPQHQGGKVLSLDMGTLVGSITAARAIGEAMAYWFGPPAGVVTETWTDRTGGVAQDLDPVFWSTWQVGDLITFTTHTPSSTTPIDAWKLHQFKPRLEDRSIDVELLKLPIQLIPADL